MKRTNWKKVGIIGVDAGLCWIGDPCYLADGKAPFNDWETFCESITGLENEPKQFNYDLGHAGLGVLTPTGYGDGAYPVYAEYKDGVVAKIMVDFMGSEEDE